jgi:hypothetical protein
MLNYRSRRRSMNHRRSSRCRCSLMNHSCVVDHSGLMNHRTMVVAAMVITIAVVVGITEQRMSRNQNDLNLGIRLLNNNLRLRLDNNFLSRLSVYLLRTIITGQQKHWDQ